MKARRHASSSYAFITQLNLHLHSAMPRGPLKTLLRYLIPELYYKPFYSLVSALFLLLIFFCWHPMPAVIWDVQHPTLWHIIMGKEYS